ncbi:MAG TPA: hypothetical protein VKP66_13310 [Steroidobacteraceae bacterium]|nr:hypothetical protein [Steroidobacteraceae bacterium]
MNSNVLSSFADQLTGAAKTTERYVRSNPWQAAVGALAVAGLAAGLLLSRGILSRGGMSRGVSRGMRRIRRGAAGLSRVTSEVLGG